MCDAPLGLEAGMAVYAPCWVFMLANARLDVTVEAAVTLQALQRC